MTRVSSTVAGIAGGSKHKVSGYPRKAGIQEINSVDTDNL